MKVYYLRIPSSDFSRTGDTWVSPVLDLYNNDYYKNYSVTKSHYGLNSLGNNVWTGLVQTAPNQTDSGTIENAGPHERARFIDTSGAISITRYTMDWDYPGSVKPGVTADFSFSDVATSYYPAEWTALVDQVPDDSLMLGPTDRYMCVSLSVDAPYDETDYDFDFLLRVSITEPTMAPFYAKTRKALDVFPQWMTMAERDAGTEPTATPTTVGGKLMNSLVGEVTDDLTGQITYESFQKFIDSADTSAKAWVYRVDLVPEMIWSITGDRVQLTRASEKDFYNSLEDEHVVFWDEDNKVLYVNRSYDVFSINGASYRLTSHPVWNGFDELGLTVSLHRLYLESNDNFRMRILDVFQNRLSVGSEGFKLALRRELDLWRIEGSTPASDYSGATPDVFEMSDLEFDNEYWTSDGLPTSKFISLVDKLAVKYPNTWGRMMWDQALWDIGGNRSDAFTTLPHVADNDILADLYLQPGVGDGNDLLVYKPGEYVAPQQFNYTLKLRGKQKTLEAQYQRLDFDVWIYGEADRKFYNNPIISIPFTVELLMKDGTTLFHTFIHTASSDVDVDVPIATDQSAVAYDFVNEAGVTSENVLLYPKVPLNLQPRTAVDMTTVQEMRLYYGTYNKFTDTYEGRVADDQFRAWIASEPGQVVTSTSADEDAPLVVSSIMYDETFSDGDGPLPIEWINEQPGWIIEQGFAVCHFGASPEAISLINVAQKTYNVNAVYGEIIGFWECGVLFRYVDSQNYMVVLPQSTGGWQYRNIVAGVITDTVDFDGAQVLGTKVRVLVSETVIKIFIDELLVATINDITNNTATKTGIINKITDGASIAYFGISGAQWHDIDMVSLVTSYEVMPWQSEKVLYHISVNGKLPGNTLQSWTVEKPTIFWDNYLEPVPNKKYIVEFATSNVDDFGVFITSNNVFYDSCHIELNGSNEWMEGKIQELDAETTDSLVFQSHLEIVDDFNVAGLLSDDPIWTTNDVWYKLYGLVAYGGTDGSGRALVHGYRNGVITATLGPVVSGSQGVIFRYVDDSNYWLFHNIDASTWVLERTATLMDDPSATVTDTLATVEDVDLTANSIITVRMEDEMITVSIDGVMVAEVESMGDYAMTTMHGVGCGMYMDNNVGSFASFACESLIDYPVMNEVWGLFEKKEVNPTSALVSDSGPWRNGIEPRTNSLDSLLDRRTVTRNDFALPDTTDYVVTWIGIESDNPAVITWLDCNTIHPYGETERTYPDNAVNELFDGDSYSYSAFAVKTKLSPFPLAEWNPQINSGYFYSKDQEYYLYTQPVTETHATPHPYKVLQNVARQGAPIIVREGATPFTQVAFTDEATPEEVKLTTRNRQVVQGNGTDTLYLGYEHAYNVAVKDITNGQTIDVLSVSSNRIVVDSITSFDIDYEVSYNISHTFAADNAYQDSSYANRTKLLFNSTPNSPYEIVYEKSLFNPATPLDIALSPFHSALDQGFIYISYDEFDLDRIIVRVSPSKIVANGSDFLVITIHSLDMYENVKQDQDFTVTTNWGSFSTDTVVQSIAVRTDKNGIAVLTLRAESSTTLTHGVVTIAGDINTTVQFAIDPAFASRYRLIAVPTPDSVKADGRSSVTVHGLVEDDQYNPVPFAEVVWAKDRTTRGVLTLASTTEHGKLKADIDGRFVVGPFTSATPDEPGYWFLSVSSSLSAATPVGGSFEEADRYGFGFYGSDTYGHTGAFHSFVPAGDVVYWQEYPDTLYGVENLSGLPKAPVQYSLAGNSTPYSDEPYFPADYNEVNPHLDATPIITNWLPPIWFSMTAYEQYLLGLFGSTPNNLDLSRLSTIRPYKRDL